MMSPSLYCVEEFLIHAGLIVEAFEAGFGGELEEIFVADFVFSQSDEVVVTVLFGVAVGALAGGDVEFAVVQGDVRDVGVVVCDFDVVDRAVVGLLFDFLQGEVEVIVGLVELTESAGLVPLQDVMHPTSRPLDFPRFARIAEAGDEEAQTEDDIARDHFDGDLTGRMPSSVAVNDGVDE